jgi:hypothetical protein
MRSVQTRSRGPWAAAGLVAAFALTATGARAETIELICNVTHVKAGYTAIDYYYIVDTAGSTVSDRSRNIGVYPAKVTPATVDWSEGQESYYLDLGSGHMTFKPGYDNLSVDWVCRRAPKTL